ncbi:MAG: glycosyltransferase family 2 protein [Bacteroidia bacterium]|nr:glycosyltransferase family 2 protein [Bacteroidia bacterium]
MKKLSVVIITFNEERNIARCLDSVKTIADEILVVDSFSTDRTEEICRAYNVRFIQHNFEGHVEQKNYALSQTTFDHIFSLDADEALSPELLASIAKVKEHWEFDAYSLSRLTNYCGKWIRHGSWYPDRKLRLFIKGKGSWTGENPHDMYSPNSPESEGKLKGDLLHFSYYSTEGHIAQVNKFTTVGAASAFRAGRKANVAMLLYKPFYKFVRDYILKLGFLDGYEGFLIARISAHATFLKYVKLIELQKKN